MKDRQGPTPKLGFVRRKLSTIRAVRAMLSGERGCKSSIPMARIVSRYNQRARQVGFEDEAHGERLGCNGAPVEAYQTTMDVPGANLDRVWS
jgi:hypothetical protein